MVNSDVSDSSQADMDDTGFSLNVKFHLEIVAFQPTFYDIGNDCSVGDAGKDITVTVTVVFIIKFFIIILENTFDAREMTLPNQKSTKLPAK